MSTAEAVPGQQAFTAESGDERIRLSVRDYFRALGLTNAELIESLTHDCLAKARRRVGRDVEDELLRRAIEEAQRRFDHALAAAAGVPPLNDPYPIARTRAAMLLSSSGHAADALFTHDASTRELGDRLKHGLPQPTPPEEHLNMVVAPLSFWFFKSTDSA